MNELELASGIEEGLNIIGLQIQVIWQDQDLVVVFNRADETHLEYDRLTKQTVKILRGLNVAPPQQMVFYSRLLGQEDPDWQKTVKIRARSESAPSVKQLEEPQAIVESIVEEEKPPEPPAPAKLSDFCFTRNKALVKTDLPAPDRRVAENVRFFHELTERRQLELAPILEDFFRSPDKTSLVSVPSELRNWFEELKKLKDAEFKSQSIWLSRYCHDREKTMGEINALLDRLAELENDKQQKLESVPATTRELSSYKRSTGKSNVYAEDSPSMGSQKFSANELIPMIGGGVLVGGIGWFLWGTALPLGAVGWIAAFAGIASGVGSVLGSDAVKIASGVVLLIIYLSIGLFVGLIIIWIEFLGWLIGLIVTFTVSTITASSGARSIFSPKPLRLLVVFTIVIAIGIGYAITSWNARLETATRIPAGEGQEVVDVVITDRQITMSNSSLGTSFTMRVENRAARPCGIWPTLVGGGFHNVRKENRIGAVRPGEETEINFTLSPEGTFQLNCDQSFSPESMDLSGPRFTVQN